MMSVARWLVGVAGCSVLVACASLQGVEDFTPGTASIEQVRAREKPAAEWKNTDGTLTLEYDNRPNTEQNVMLDFDAKGQLAAVREVISLENMARLRLAMTKTEVKRILGNPRYVWTSPVTGGEVWEWPLDRTQDEMAMAQICVYFHATADGVIRFDECNRFK